MPLLETIKRIVLLIFIVTMFSYAAVSMLATTDDAGASYRPAPQYLVQHASRATLPQSGTLTRRAWIICHVWGVRWKRCAYVLNVAWCESTLNTAAANGQYLGVFQMGSGERARFGHGASVWVQARAAKHYWNGSHWRPWQCQPTP